MGYAARPTAARVFRPHPTQPLRAPCPYARLRRGVGLNTLIRQPKEGSGPLAARP